MIVRHWLLMESGESCSGICALSTDYTRIILCFDDTIHLHSPVILKVWPEIIGKAKDGGLDVIETYVFWNYHEPVRGEYYFGGRLDRVRFVKNVHEASLFVYLRIGPYACVEWNYGLVFHSAFLLIIIVFTFLG
ncbi:hypothetical protein ACS0TY_020156 [Phlomoides rotata]